MKLMVNVGSKQRGEREIEEIVFAQRIEEMSLGGDEAGQQLFQLLSTLLTEVEAISNEEEVDLRAKIEALKLEVTKVPSRSIQNAGDAEIEVASALDKLSCKLEEVDEMISTTITTDPQVKSILSSTADMWMPVITATSEERSRLSSLVRDDKQGGSKST